MKQHMVMQRLLHVEKLKVAYGDAVILRDVNLQVFNITRPDMNQGQVVSLLGPSGVGKTQLLRCIAGLQTPTEGRIEIIDKNYYVPTEAGKVGVVFQSYPLFDDRTVMDNLKLAVKLADKSANTPAKDPKFYLERFHLEDKANLYPSKLSGGQRQRVAIIQQLLTRKQLILMDEPFSGLDPLMKQAVADMIRELSILHEENTFIITTHDIEMAVGISDTIWMLGREPDKPGATVTKVVNLIERDIAWEPKPEEHPNFIPTVKELKSLFKR